MLIIVLAVITFAIILWIITVTNNFKRLEVKIEEARSGIEVALEKRYDTLTKLRDAAGTYMKHESSTFQKIVALRKGMSLKELEDADNQMIKMSNDLLALGENYPELRSSDVFIELEKGVSDAEEHLQAARRVYNANVSSYNTAIAMFPNSLLKGSRQSLPFYAADSRKHQDVEMKF